jgi:hypothetical protein
LVCTMLGALKQVPCTYVTHPRSSHPWTSSHPQAAASTQSLHSILGALTALQRQLTHSAAHAETRTAGATSTGLVPAGVCPTPAPSASTATRARPAHALQANTEAARVARTHNQPPTISRAIYAPTPSAKPTRTESARVVAPSTAFHVPCTAGHARMGNSTAPKTGADTTTAGRATVDSPYCNLRTRVLTAQTTRPTARRSTASRTSFRPPRRVLLRTKQAAAITRESARMAGSFL